MYYFFILKYTYYFNLNKFCTTFSLSPSFVKTLFINSSNITRILLKFRMSVGMRIIRVELHCHPNYVDSNARVDSDVFTRTASTYPVCHGKAYYHESHVLFSQDRLT